MGIEGVDGDGMPGGGGFEAHERGVEDLGIMSGEVEVEFLVDGAEERTGVGGEGVVGDEEGLGGWC